MEWSEIQPPAATPAQRQAIYRFLFADKEQLRLLIKNLSSAEANQLIQLLVKAGSQRLQTNTEEK